MKKTAVQLLIETLEKDGLELFGMEEFLEVEKEQNIAAFENGLNCNVAGATGEEYFIQTFGNK